MSAQLRPEFTADRLASSIEALKEMLEKVVTDMEIVEAWADALPRDEKEKEIQKQVRGIMVNRGIIQSMLTSTGRAEGLASEYYQEQE